MPHTWFLCAQRRPGPRPRRHRYRRGGHGDNGGRSTKAGAETPATRLPELPGRDHEIMRSTKAGAETPATPLLKEERCRTARNTLNEGRGRDPGDTPHRPRPMQFWGQTLNEGRGRDPGDTITCTWHPIWYSNAQRRPGPRPRRHNVQPFKGVALFGRSTKAGAETPATHANISRWTASGWALNEGRGRDSGDTANRRRTTRKPVCRRLTAILTTGSARVWVWMSSQTRRCPRNLRRITTLSQAALESPGVRSFPVRAPKARRARASQSGQTGSELRKCDS